MNQFSGRVRMGRIDRDADTRRNLYRLALHRAVFHAGNGLAEPFGQAQRDLQRRFGQNDDELLSAIARGKIGIADIVQQNPRQILQHFIAGLVTVAVIDLLEMIEIQREYR